MNVTIKHFTQTGSSTWVLMNENKELMYDKNDNALFGYTRKEAEALADKLDSIEISDIKIPLYSNFDAKPKTKGKDIKNSLVNQLENPVLWYDTINNMTNDGCSSYIEIGPGKVLQGLNRKIDKSLSNIGIQNLQDIMKYEI